MRFDTIIIGGGLAGLVSGISLQKAGQQTAIVSMGQNALHFFSGSFESVCEADKRIIDLFAEAGVRLHYSEGVRLMPLGTFKDAALSLEDVDLLPSRQFARKVLIVSFSKYYDFFTGFLAEGLGREGISCNVREIDLPGLDKRAAQCGEKRAVHLSRIVDRNWDKVVQEVRAMITDEDAVILPQVFGLEDPSIPAQIRQGIPAKVIFAGTLPPSVPGMRTQMLLKRRYQLLGGTFLMGDEALRAHIHEGRVHSIVTRNLDSNYLLADRFILATGHFFSKGLRSNPSGISEPLFGLDVDFDADRNGWYDPRFAGEQPYMQYGVRTDECLHPLLGGAPVHNLYAAGSVLGGTRPELGSGGGLAIRSALAVVDQITQEL